MEKVFKNPRIGDTKKGKLVVFKHLNILWHLNILVNIVPNAVIAYNNFILILQITLFYEHNYMDMPKQDKNELRMDRNVI
jgi:hypothetical protein